MSRNEIILGVVALVLVGFSLFVSLVVPRRRPDFPAPRLGLFVFVCLLLVAAMLATVEAFGVEEESEEAEAGEVREEPGAETGEEPGEEPPPEGGATGEEEGGGGGGGDPARGEEVFASAGCATCHTLEAAGATGTVGPSLDGTSLTQEEVAAQVENGGEGMPAFAGELSPEDIQAVAAFVVEAGGR